MKTTALICAAFLAGAPAGVFAQSPPPRPASFPAASESSPAPRPTKSDIAALIEREALDQDVPPALAVAIAQVESGLNPNAKGIGTLGLMQIQMPTARSVGYGGSEAGLYDARTNARYGIRYLKRALDLCDGDARCAAGKYKTGLRSGRNAGYEKKIALAGGF